METICHFDMFDRCVGFETTGIALRDILATRMNDPVLSGTYILPPSLDPIGMDAGSLWYYRKGA